MTTPKLQVPIAPDKELHEIALLRRRLVANRLQFRLLILEHQLIEAQINAEVARYKAALGPAVAEVKAMWGCE